MAKRREAPQAHKERELACRLWLAYYNRMLYERGLITRRDRDRMALKIDGWPGPAPRAEQGL